MPSRTAWIDNARTYSVLAVVMLHVSAGVVTGFRQIPSAYWHAGNAYDSLSRWCVPTFVMVSGALLLDPRRNEGIGEFYRSRALRIAPPLVFWSLFYLGLKAVRQQQTSGTVSIGELARSLVTGQPYFHLWYLYMLIGLYIATPFLRALIANLDRAQTTAFCATVLTLAMANTASNFLIGGGSAFFLAWFLPHIGYYVAGFLIARADQPAPRRVSALVFFACAWLTATGCWAVARSSSLDRGLYFYEYFSVTVVPMSLAAFHWLRTCDSRGMAARLAPLSFGIYLVHPIFLAALDIEMKFSLVEHNPLWAIPVVTLVVFGASALAVAVLARIPLVRRIV